MAGGIALSSLRVTAEMDGSAYKAGADAIEAANRRIADSGQAAGAALAAQDVAAGRSGGTLTSLSRAYVEGYSASARFAQQVGQLQNQMELGNASADRAAQIYTGLTSKFNLYADASKIAAGGNRDFAAVIDQVNAKAAVQIDIMNRLAASQQAAAKAQTFQTGINTNLGVVSPQVQQETTAKSQADVVAYGKELDNLRAKYVPLAGAQQVYVKTLREINDAGKTGALTEAERAAAIQRTKDAFAQQVTATKAAADATTGYGASAGYGVTQASALFAALRHTFDAYAAGMPLTRVLAMEAGNLSYGLSGAGGLAGAFDAVTTKIGGFATTAAAFVTPAVAAAGVMGTFATIGIAAAVSWENAQRGIERALQGIGRQSGVTAADINGIAESTASSSKLSIGQASDLAVSYAATGRIAKENIAPAVQVTEGLAKALGVDGSAAAKLLGAALADPAKGVAELDSKVGAFNVQMREMIAQALRNGDVQQAQALMIQGVVVATQGAIEANKGWGDSFSDVWKKIKDGANLVGKDLVQGAQLVGHDLGGAPASAGVPKQQQLATAQSDVASFQAQLPGNLAANAGDPQAVQAIYDAYARLLGIVSKLKEELAAADIASWNAKLDEWAGRADAATQAMVPQTAQIKQLEAAISDLTRAQNFLDVSGRQAQGGDSAAALTAAQNKLKILQESKSEASRYNDNVKQIAASYTNVGTQVALQLQRLENQLPVAQAVSAAAKMRAQQEATVNELLGQGKTIEEATALAAAQYALQKAAAEASAEKQVQSSRDNLDLLRAAGTADEARLKSAIAYRNAMDAGASASQAAAISANTFAAESIRAADASQQVAQNWETAARAAQDARAAAINARQGNSGGQFGGSAQTAAFGDFGGGQGFTSSFVVPQNFFTNATSFNTMSAVQAVGDLVQQVLGQGGSVAQAIARVQNSGTSNQLFGGGPSAAQQQSDQISTLTTLYGLLNSQTTDKNVQISNDQQFLSWLERQPQTIANLQAIANLTSEMRSLTEATTAGTTAITELPGYLSSLYSAGQVKGFGFADGGVMTSAGPLPLNKYASGGVVSTPQVYMAGENYKPEAIIPLKDGAVPVQFSGGIPIRITIANDNAASKQQPPPPIYINAPITIVASPDGGISQATAQAAQELQGMLAGFARR